MLTGDCCRYSRFSLFIWRAGISGLEVESLSLFIWRAGMSAGGGVPDSASSLARVYMSCCVYAWESVALVAQCDPQVKSGFKS